MNDAPRAMGTQPLPVNHELLWYTIEAVLGHGGFGTTYLATDKNLNRKVAIKEYLPSMFAYRNPDFTVSPLSDDHDDNYNWGLTSFLNEARTLAQFKHRNIVQVQTVFEEYNTAYMVMEYEHGDPLDHVIKTRSTELDQNFFESLLFLVMEGLQSIHDAGFIHRDIKPGNLYIRADDSPVLIDFGSARQTSQQETSEMTTLVSQGYTPLEQYSSNFGDQGPWTDIYSLAASVYHGVTGQRPDDALNRSASLISARPDPLQTLSSLNLDGYSEQFCHAIDGAMVLKPSDRPQSLAAWRDVFEGGDIQPADHDPTGIAYEDDVTRLQPAPHLSAGLSRSQPSASPAPQHDTMDLDDADWNREPATRTHQPAPAAASPVKKQSNAPLILGAGVLLCALAGGGWWFTQQDTDTPDTITVTSQLLSELPRPATTSALQVPTELVAGEIAELRVLSTAYQELLALDPDSGQGKEGMSFVLDNYRSIAALSALENSDSLRSKLAAALQAVTIKTDTNGEAEQLAATLDAMPATPTFTDLESLLDQDDLDDKDREHLIYGLGSLNPQDKAKALADRRVISLTRQFKDSIVVSVKDRQFNRANHMTALALLINPDDAELKLLKNHLENGG